MRATTTRKTVRLIRLARVLLHLVRALLTVAFVYPCVGHAAQRRRLAQWSAQLMRMLAVDLHVHGAPPCDGVVLFVGNHVSWLDIFAINAVRPARFVAKAEIRGWPLIGWLCARGGTLFIDRSRRHHTAEINAAMADAMRAGDAFAVFPEGTTTHGDVLRPFHASLLQPALACDAQVVPVAIRYTRSDGSLCLEADYEGDKTLVQSLLQLVTQPRVRLDLHILPPVGSAGMHRRELADSVARQIALSLGLDAPSKRAETARDRTT